MPSQYPTALDTTTTLSTAVNGLQTTLTGDHTSGATTITVGSTSGAASAGYVWVDSEVIKYAGTTPTTLTGCTRGADGTAAAQHSNGAIVKFGLVADHHNALVTGLIAVQNKLGLNTNGASATSIDGNQLAAGTVVSSKIAANAVFNANLNDSDVLFRRMKLENNITRLFNNQAPATFAATGGVWSSGNIVSMVITPAVASYLFIWCNMSYATTAAAGTVLSSRVTVDSVASSIIGQGTVPGANQQISLSLFDVVPVAAGAHTLQPQQQPSATGTLTTIYCQVLVLAIPST